MRRSAPITTLVALALTSAASAGPDWTEVGDAGKNSAQSITIATQPDTIAGTLGGAASDADGGVDAVDAYNLVIEGPETFIATTTQAMFLDPEVGPPLVAERTGTLSSFNSSLYLFRVDRQGILANRDIATNDLRSRLFPMPTDGLPTRIPGPGRYILAISYGDVNPVGTSGQPLFNFDDGAGQFQISGPDGSSLGPANDWSIPAGVPRPQVKYVIRILGEGGCFPCQGDANYNGVVNFADITTVLNNFNNVCP